MTSDNSALRVDVALIHHPVVNKLGDIIGSAVTNLDLHDIARAGKTFGIDNYWVVTPFAEQQQLCKQIVSHWTEGYGSRANPKRKMALSLIKVCSDLDEVLEKISKKWNEKPRVIATCAKSQPDTVTYENMRHELLEGQPSLLLFGTAWGLAPELLKKVDATLPPLCGYGEYNHLSVRSAVSIILDRLLSNRQ